MHHVDFIWCTSANWLGIWLTIRVWSLFVISFFCFYSLKCYIMWMFVHWCQTYSFVMNGLIFWSVSMKFQIKSNKSHRIHWIIYKLAAPHDCCIYKPFFNLISRNYNYNIINMFPWYMYYYYDFMNHSEKELKAILMTDICIYFLLYTPIYTTI